MFFSCPVASTHPFEAKWIMAGSEKSRGVGVVIFVSSWRETLHEGLIHYQNSHPRTSFETCPRQLPSLHTAINRSCARWTRRKPHMTRVWKNLAMFLFSSPLLEMVLVIYIFWWAGLLRECMRRMGKPPSQKWSTKFSEEKREVALLFLPYPCSTKEKSTTFPIHWHSYGLPDTGHFPWTSNSPF